MAFPRKKSKANSPVTTPLRRLPGESVRKELERIVDEQVAAYIFYPLAFWALAAWEYFRRWMRVQLDVAWLVAIAIGISIYCAWRVVQRRQEIRNLWQAERAERHVSDLLRRLRDKDYVTFDDLSDATGRTDTNIDHVVVGPGGIFAVETKGYSLFGNRTAEVGADGVLLLSGTPALKNPLGQAKGSAAKVSEHLKACLQEKRWVQPILALPGWKVGIPKTDVGVPILTDETISEYFNSLPRTLSNQEIRDICSHLDRTARV